jgi:hypothetical protein
MSAMGINRQQTLFARRDRCVSLSGNFAIQASAPLLRISSLIRQRSLKNDLLADDLAALYNPVRCRVLMSWGFWSNRKQTASFDACRSESRHCYRESCFIPGRHERDPLRRCWQAAIHLHFAHDVDERDHSESR